MKETASKVKNDNMSRILASMGVRMVGGSIAETPEREFDHGGNDGRRTENIMQDKHTDHINGI